MFVKCYGFFFFFLTKNVSKSIGKITSKNVSSKHSQKFLNHAKQSLADALKTASEKQFQKQQKELVI